MIRIGSYITDFGLQTIPNHNGFRFTETLERDHNAITVIRPWSDHNGTHNNGNWFTDDGDHNGNWFTETSDRDHNGKIQQSMDHSPSIIDHGLLATISRYWLKDDKTWTMVPPVSIYTFVRVPIKS